MQRIFGRSPSSEAKIAGRSAVSLPQSDNQSGLISASASGYEVLLDSGAAAAAAAGNAGIITSRDAAGMIITRERPNVRRDRNYHQGHRGAWLLSTTDARSRPSWNGQGRPPPRKLVKEPSGSARPSFSVEISDGEKGRRAWNSGGTSGGGDGKGIRQRVARWKGLHWGGAGSAGSTSFATGAQQSSPP